MGGPSEEAMSQIRDCIEVNVPVHAAYDQWTQFESFPRFMDGIKSVQQLDPRHLHWIAELGGRQTEWDAEITSNMPDREIAWTSTNGAQNAGTVKFNACGSNCTEVELEMMTEPEGAVENIGSALGLDDRTVHHDLENFKRFVESRGDYGNTTPLWHGGSDI
jgi:uncharacterized membrane protein